MESKIYQFIILIGINLLFSCESLHEKNSIRSTQNPNAGKLVDSNYVREVLYSQFNDWQGVKYQQGGLSQSGIDCSGFVHLTFKSKFGLLLPRTTWMQAKFGREIKKDKLKAGDLIFFRTSVTSNHVGIYLEKDKFLHVSQKRGITISSLNNIYWKSRYWKAVRI